MSVAAEPIGAGAPAITLGADDLDPLVLQLGLLLGILEPDGDRYEVDAGWLADPITQVKEIPSERADQVVALLKTLLGSSAGSALGVPIKDNGELWYPFLVPGETPPAPSPFYLVTPEQVTATSATIGVGALKSFTVAGITITPFVKVPVIQLGADPQFVIASSPIELGVEVTGVPFVSGEVSFQGLQFSLELQPTSGVANVELVFLKLALPGLSVADRSLQDLRALGAGEWIASGVAVVAGQLLAEITDTPTRQEVLARLDDLLELAGLTPGLGGLAWDDLVSGKVTPQEAFVAWLGNVGASTTALRSWLNVVACFVQGTTPKPDGSDVAQNVAGTGSRADPLAVTLIPLTAGASLVFTVARATDDSGTLHLYPGVQVASAALALPNLQTAGVSAVAGAEIADLHVQSTTAKAQGVELPGLSALLFPSLDLSVVVANQTAGKPLVAGADAMGAFSLGSVAGGVSYSGASGTILPALFLNDVVTPVGSWPAIDLTNGPDVVKAAEEALTTAVQKAIDTFLGTGPDAEPQSLTGAAAAIAALLGIQPPQGYTGAWPVTELLLDAGDLPLLVANPLAALGAYYTRALSVQDAQGRPALADLVPCLAQLAGGSGSLDGSGTMSDPWESPVHTVGGVTFAVAAWVPEPSALTNRELHVGLRFHFSQPVGTALLEVSAGAELFDLRLPDAAGAGSLAGHWFTGAGGGIVLASKDPGPLTPPSLGGVAVQVKDVSLTSGWERSSGLYVLAEIAQPVLVAEGVTVPLPSIDFSFGSGSPWNENQLIQLLQAAVDLAGLLLLEHGGRTGVALTTLFGLLPNLNAVYAGNSYPFPLPPSPFQLPSSWPALTVPTTGTVFSMPWAAVRAQLGAVLGTPANAAAALQIVGWAITGTLPTAPPTAPAGTYDDPYSVLLPDVKDVELLVWTEPPTTGAGPGRVGLGLQRSMSAATLTAVELDAIVRADVARFAIANPGQPVGAVPRVALELRLASPTAGQPLVASTATGLQIGSAVLGGSVSGEGGAVVATLLRSTPSKSEAVATCDIVGALGSSDQMQALARLLAAMMGFVGEQLEAEHALSAEPTLLDTALDLLVALKLVHVRGKYRLVSPLAFLSLLADPETYVRNELARIAADPAAAQPFFADLAALLGLRSFTPPPALQGLEFVLAAFGLLTQTPTGYLPAPASWLALANDPVKWATAQAGALFASPDALQALVSALSKLSTPSAAKARAELPLPSWLQFSIEKGTRVTIGVPSGSPLRAGEVAVAGSLTLDLKAMSVGGDAVVWMSSFGAGLGGSLSLATDQTGNVTPAWQLDLQAAPDGRTRTVAPVPLYGNPAPPDLVARLASTVPLFALSTISAALLNGFVVPNSPLAGRLLTALGVADPPQQVGNGAPSVRSLFGAVADPRGWLLSSQVLGDGDGGLDAAKLAQALAYTVGESSVHGPGDVVLSAVANGLQLSRLPFGGSLTLTAVAGVGLQLTIEVDDSTTVPGLEVDVKPVLTYDLAAGLALTGQASLKTTVGTDGWAQVTCAHDGANLTVSLGTSSLPSDETVPLVPFGGLNAFFGSALEQTLLVWFVEKLLDAYNALSTKPLALQTLVDALKAAANQIGIENRKGLETALGELVHDPLQWLADQVSPTQVGYTITAAVSLLHDGLGLTGIARDGNRLVYAPSLSSTLGSIQLSVGMAEDGAGHTFFGAWVEPKANLGPLVLDLTAGAGLLDPIDPKAPKLDLVLGLDASLAQAYVPPVMPGQPTLKADLTGAPDAWSFDLRVYPAGAVDTSSPYASLLPTVGLGVGTNPGTELAAAQAESWLASFAYDFVMPLLSNVVLQTPAVQTWLTTPIPNTTVTAEQVLTAFGLIAKGPPLALVDPHATFGGKSASQVFELLLGAVLPSLKGVTLLKAGNATVTVASTTDSSQNTFYGLEFQLPNIVLTDPSATPQVIVQIGQGLTPAYAWITKLDPNAPGGANEGLTLMLLQVPPSGAPTLAPGFTLVDVGVDVLGGDKKPLVDVGGFQIEQIQTRLYLAVEDAAGLTVDFGAAVMLDQIAIPLGPKLKPDGTAGGTNKIAANLLSSSSGGGGSGSKGVNPAFDASAAFVWDKANVGAKFEVLFYQGGSSAPKLTLPIQRALGPLYCRSVLIGYEAPVFEVGFDGSVSLAGLAVDLEDLEIGIALDKNPLDPSTYTLELAGIDVSFKGGPVAINGGLLKYTDPTLEYIGVVSVIAADFGLTAMGAYALLGSNQPSLFVFGGLQAPLGGPPYFFVTGVAAGFGYNRDLILPAQDQVSTYPLVAGVLNPSEFQNDKPDEVLAKLAADVPPRAGQYWLAAGVMFTTFEQLQSFGLLAVTFGTEFSVALLGVSTLAIPSQAEGVPAKPIAQATLDLEAVFRPAAGYLSVTAALAPDSYVLSPDAQLTGGFALEVWFGGENAGQFVVTLGGYHPAFHPPSYFPQEPRLGLNWPMGDLLVKGGCYFAITPSAAMAGGGLSVTYQSGALKAWFDANADFLVNWKPFRFRAGVSVSVGASYRVDVWFVHHTFTVELGASLDLWGTPVGGNVHISWFIISFTVGFGPDPAQNVVDNWSQFDASFLPQKTGIVDAKVSVTAAGGLMQTLDPGANTQWVLNPQHFRLLAKSVVPSVAATWNGTSLPLAGSPVGSKTPVTSLSVRPLAKLNEFNQLEPPPPLGSTLELVLQEKDELGNWGNVGVGKLVVTPIIDSVPAALWGSNPQPTPSSEVVADVCVGFELVPSVAPTNPTAFVPVANFAAQPQKRTVSWAQPAQPTNGTWPGEDTVPFMMTQLKSPSVVQTRDALTATLAVTNAQLPLNGGPVVLAAFADQILQAPINLVTLGAEWTKPREGGAP